MSIRKGTELIAGNVNQSTVSTFKLFHHDWFDYSFSDLSWVCADDFEWIYGDRYPIAYEHLYADFISTSTYTQETIGSYTIQFKIAPDGHRIVDHANEGIVQNIYGESGVAWYYILDTVNERFKLPRTKHGLSGLRDNVGKYIAPGAPNITGTTNGGSYGSMRSGNPSTPSVSGCFTGTISRGLAGENTNYGMHVNFDASKSNSIYGASDTIQPPSTQQYLYFYLGQFPVSALVNPDIAATKVNTNGDNFNSVGRNIANWSSNVTNCITEIPQDIKLELDTTNHSLILKAGSKVWYPDGFESDGTTPKFSYYSLDTDRIAISLSTVAFDNVIIVNLYDENGEHMFWGEMADTFSGPTTPTLTGKRQYWYDTTNNIIKYYDPDTSTWNTEFHGHKFIFPLGLFYVEGNTGFTNIKQVFNGFGYIGSTVFALPGIKGLIPNGRNANGTLKSIEFTTNDILTKTNTYTLISDHWFICNGNYLELWDTVDWIKYNEKENIIYNKQTGAKISYCVCGTLNCGGTDKIATFEPKTVLPIVSHSDCVKYCSFNTNTRIQMTDTNQIAPKNGWLIGTMSFAGSNIDCKIYINDILVNRGGWTENNGTWKSAAIQLPLKAGQRFKYVCSGVQGTDRIYFYPDD